MSHSVTDLSVAGANSQYFELLFRGLPAELVLDFFDAAMSWQLRHTIADRFAGMVAAVRETVERTPAFAGRADTIARDCVEFYLRSNATLFALVSQLDGHAEPALAVRWRGRDRLRRLADSDRRIVAIVPHLAYFYAVPFLLADHIGRAAVLGNVVAGEVLSPVFPALAPRLQGCIEYIKVPDPTSARVAFAALQRGVPLVVFPEMTQGATGNIGSVTASFLGRRVWVPTTIARFARMAKADILPIRITPLRHREIAVEIDEPVPCPADRTADGPVSLSLFAWLESIVLAQPHLWWGWPMLDTHMAAGGSTRPG